MPWLARQARPPSRRGTTWALWCSLALVVGGCAGYRTVSPNKVLTPAQIRIDFPVPQRTVFHSTQGDSVVLDSVVRVEGTALLTEADSITMRPSKAWIKGSETPWRFSSAAIVRLPAGTLKLKKGNKGLTALVLVTVLAGVVALVAAAAGSGGSSSNPSPPPPSKM